MSRAHVISVQASSRWAPALHGTPFCARRWRAALTTPLPRDTAARHHAHAQRLGPLPGSKDAVTGHAERGALVAAGPRLPLQRAASCPAPRACPGSALYKSTLERPTNFSRRSRAGPTSTAPCTGFRCWVSDTWWSQVGGGRRRECLRSQARDPLHCTPSRLPAADLPVPSATNTPPGGGSRTPRLACRPQAGGRGGGSAIPGPPKVARHAGEVAAAWQLPRLPPPTWGSAARQLPPT